MWRTSLRVCGYFHEFDEMAWGRSDNPFKQRYNPLIHQRFRESKIHVVMLLLNGHNANHTKLFQAVMQENPRKWCTRTMKPNPSLSCVTHIKISFNVWNLVKFKTIKNYLCHYVYYNFFAVKRRSRTVLFSVLCITNIQCTSIAI